VHVVEVSTGEYVNFRGEKFPAWVIQSIHGHPEFANQKADELRGTGRFRVRVRPATQ
jgi:hypothetical protein